MIPCRHLHGPFIKVRLFLLHSGPYEGLKLTPRTLYTALIMSSASGGTVSGRLETNDSETGANGWSVLSANEDEEERNGRSSFTGSPVPSSFFFTEPRQPVSGCRRNTGALPFIRTGLPPHKQPSSKIERWNCGNHNKKHPPPRGPRTFFTSSAVIRPIEPDQ